MSHRDRAAEPDPYSFGARPYDLVKEFTIALVAVLILTVALAAVFSSPDQKPLTIAAWAKADPGNFTATALAELDGTSPTAVYGPPYNHGSTGQKLGPLALAKLAGVTHPINTAQAFVLAPLTAAPQNPAITAALSVYRAATPAQRTAWTSAYADALAKAGAVPANVPAGDYGPVPALLRRLLGQAQAGSLDGALLSEHGFYQTNYTLPLMFLADGTDLANHAAAEHFASDQWGMMNETGNFPGQPWLWLYTFWYQIPPYSTSGNADALVMATMGILVMMLVFVPFIPGLRSIPRLIPIYRLIWREHYKDHG